MQEHARTTAITSSPSVRTAEVIVLPNARGGPLDVHDRLERRFDGWRRNATGGTVLWVDVIAQRVWLVEDGIATASWVCSTARAGLGETDGSFRTPRGWHEVAEKIGDDLPHGAVLRARRWTGDVWHPGERDDADEDLVLTRILRLVGREPGRNLGGNRDSFRRFIYLHGTNAEHELGRPVSHGCIRLSNADVTCLYDLVVEGCPVLID